MKRVSYLVLVFFLGMFAIVERTMAQSMELKKINLNVFRIDAATVVARVHGYFAAEGLEVDVTLTPNSTEQMRGASQGKFEIVSTAFDNVLAWSGREGAEIIAVAQISDKTVLPVFVGFRPAGGQDLERPQREETRGRRRRHRVCLSASTSAVG
jgi:ABC-type nitrate/sulfonate/bicarbonate transport system substrate-binding protein